MPDIFFTEFRLTWLNPDFSAFLISKMKPKKSDIITYELSQYYNRHTIRQYGLWGFQTGGIKLERILAKNQHTQRKFLNFENWTNGEPL